MSLRKGVHSGNPQTRTLVALCGEKRLEDPPSNLRRNSRAVVPNLDPGSAICGAREYGNATFALEGIHGVEEQIHECSHTVRGTNQGQRRRPQLQHQFNSTQRSEEHTSELQSL